MKNFKIIDEVNPPVLVARDRDEEGNEIVRLQTWDNDEDLLSEEEVIFTHPVAAQRFVTDFSNEAAYEFLERQNLA